MVLKESYIMSVKPKFCKDCKHFNTYYHYLCTNPKLVKYDLISGKESYSGCDWLRTNEDKCGFKAIYFEPKNENPTNL